MAACLALATQHINSFRASGVRLSHWLRALVLALKAFFRSDAILCTVPLAIAI